MKHQELIFSNDVAAAIDRLVDAASASQLFVLVDVNTKAFVLPRLAETSRAIAAATPIVIKSGDINKNLDSLSSIWKQLGENNATRHALMINLGGGMVTDIGGFAASTFKRGIRFINIPTTLLGAVDAAVGGKTGINFGGLKNEVGVFNEASAVVISTLFLSSLPIEEILSGYAEMLKHGLIDSVDAYNRLLAYDVATADADRLLSLLEESVQVKRRIVTEDPTEHGIRRALNLGHTVGHAFESLAMKRHDPVPHGYAVAWGLVVELILSHMRLGFPSNELHRFAAYILRHYGAFEITCDDYPTLVELMHHDKKNRSSEINFTLLSAPGKVQIDCTAPEEEIATALDIYRDLMRI